MSLHFADMVFAMSRSAAEGDAARRGWWLAWDDHAGDLAAVLASAWAQAAVP
jgi:hypothetical protein